MDSSEFLEFLAGRSSVRDFSPDEISEREIVFLLDCASTAPSAGNLEAWDMVMVRDPERREALSAANPIECCLRTICQKECQISSRLP